MEVKFIVDNAIEKDLNFEDKLWKAADRLRKKFVPLSTLMVKRLL
ncbi:MAG: hypothetical protein ABIL37_05920 [candidate division WOR-3 bacterium]